VAVHVSIQRGFDASYPWRQIGTGATGQEQKPPLDYYLAPAQGGGEPPGRWIGRGLATLGFTPGQVIDRGAFEKLFGEHLDPRDPSGQTRLGRAAQQFASEDDIYAALVAAEPHASDARRAELRVQARAQARHAVPFWDITLSVSKSVSLFHGSLLAKAEQARQAGDLAGGAEFDRLAAQVWADIDAAGEAMLAYLQDTAGYVRTGYHRGSGAESGAELGKWEDAHAWVAGRFDQHTSRDGDPQLHAHNLVLNKVATERDGQWRKLDSRGLYRERRAAAAVADATLRRLLSEHFGLVWLPRADGQGHEIKGVSPELMERFSSRRQSITAQAKQLAQERQREWGRAPSAWQMDRIQRDITFRTRQAKPEKPLDIPGLLHEWEDKAVAADLAGLESVYDAVMGEAHAAREQEQAVAELARQIAWQVAERHGTMPEAAEQARIKAFAGFVTRRGELTGPFDPVALARGYAAQERADAERERDIRREIGRAQAQAHAHAAAQTQGRARALAQAHAARGYAVAYPVHGAQGLTGAEAVQVMSEALAVVQAKRPTWAKADLIAQLAERMPGHAHADRATLEALAQRALTGGAGEPVVLLSAPEWTRVPASLRRADGTSVFRPPGADQYATQAQLTLEERLIAQAQASGAPHLDPDAVVRMLGAERARLEAQLAPEPTTAAVLTETTGSGLRMDQAVAAYFLLTSQRRVEVLVGPAGTGKTRTAAEMARIWQATGTGPVVALTTSSNARNVIRQEAAAHDVSIQAYNTAEWLGHTETAREARPPIDLAPGTLLLVDEGSMASLPDLAAIVRRATEHGAKVVVTGDPMQLQAVEGAGGMELLARRLGHVQISEAWRFHHAWEREATLRLRNGDVTVLADYRQHGRLHVGTAEQMLDEAPRAYLHDRLNGHDTLLMAGSDALAAELSRRVRGDLIRWGILSDGPTVRLRDGAEASAGDLIMARKNDNSLAVDPWARPITNRDLLRIIDTSPDSTGVSVQVERLTGRDPDTGREQWSAPFTLPKDYLLDETHLAYAVTFHTAEGRTVGYSGISVFTGAEDRQAVNVALTRGRERNDAYVIGGWQLSDSQPGSGPAPELARQARLDRELAGLVPQCAGQVEDDRDRGQVTAEEILGQCLARDDRQMAATDIRDSAWSDTDRLDVLGVQWDHLAREASQRLYEAAARAVLPEEQARQVLGDPAATWLWRSLREAEAAGLDGPAVLRRAVAAGQLADAESVAKVVDWRVRQQTAGMPALAARPRSDQVPQTGDQDMDRYAAELAAAMADRQRRLGEHAAEHPPAWARTLGPVPEHPVDRADWEHKAGLVAAYRERWGYAHPHEPIGARPGQHSPDAQADWQAAAEVLGYGPGDLREHTDGQLWAWRSTFAREMAWAPEHKGEDLATVREEVRRTQIEADRVRRNAQSAGATETRQRLTDRAAVLGQWEQMARDLEGRLAQAQAGYDAWEQATAPTRDRAVAADAELRRRDPDRVIEPLRAKHAEPQPEPAAAPERLALAEPEPAPAPGEPDPAPAVNRMDEVAEQLRQISARLDEAALRQAEAARQKAAEITSLQHQPDPSAEPVAAWKTDLEARQRDAVRHEPMPRIPHAEPIAAAREARLSEPEAAD
jgi:hypothetical protein